MQIDLSTNKVARVYSMDASVARDELPERRSDRPPCHLPKSGMGAVIVVDLTTGRARRLLANSTKTRAVPGRTPVIDGRKVLRLDGTIPIVNADGIEDQRAGSRLAFIVVILTAACGK